MAGNEFTTNPATAPAPAGIPAGSVRTPDGGWRTPSGQVVYVDTFTNPPPVPRPGIPAVHSGSPRNYMPQLGLINRFDPRQSQSLTEDELRKSALAKLRGY